MSRFICKLDDIYFEWSTVVDAPVTFGMSLEEFTEYYRFQYGQHSFESEFGGRMGRVEAKGTSSMLDSSIDELISFNRAGPKESCIDKETLIKYLKDKKDWQNSANIS